MGSVGADRTTAGAKLIAVVIAVLLVVPFVAMLSGGLFYLAILAWKTVAGML